MTRRALYILSAAGITLQLSTLVFMVVKRSMAVVPFCMVFVIIGMWMAMAPALFAKRSRK